MELMQAKIDNSFISLHLLLLTKKYKLNSKKAHVDITIHKKISYQSCVLNRNNEIKEGLQSCFVARGILLNLCIRRSYNSIRLLHIFIH